MHTGRNLALMCVMALSACGADGVTKTKQGEAAILRVGQAAQLSDGDLKFGVSSVPEDSRCPEGVVCVWAGAASVSLWLETARQREELLLTTAPFSGHTSRGESLGYEVELADVAPAKRGTLRQSDYRITLLVRSK